MLEQVPAYARQVGDDRNIEGSEMIGRADAGTHEQGWRVRRTRTQNDRGGLETLLRPAGWN